MNRQHNARIRSICCSRKSRDSQCLPACCIWTVSSSRTPVFWKCFFSSVTLERHATAAVCNKFIKQMTKVHQARAYGGSAVSSTDFIWPWPRPFSKNFKAWRLTVHGNIRVKFEVHSFNRVGAISINVPKFRELSDPGHASFPKNFRGSCLDCLSNLKSVALTIFEILAFNAQTGLIDRSAVHRHTQTQTHIERKQYLHHSLRSLDGDNNNNSYYYYYEINNNYE